jgi:hypothetical protein
MIIHYICLTPLLQLREVSGRSAGHVDELRGAAAGRPRRLRHVGLPHLLTLLTLQRDHRQQAVRHVARYIILLLPVLKNLLFPVLFFLLLIGDFFSTALLL